MDGARARCLLPDQLAGSRQRNYSTLSWPPGFSPPPVSGRGSNISELDAGETSVADHGFGAGGADFVLFVAARERVFPPLLAEAFLAGARLVPFFVPFFAGLRAPFLVVLRAVFFAALRVERLPAAFLAGLLRAPFRAPLDFLRPFLATMLLSPCRIR